MSIPVDVKALAAQIDERTMPPYLLTTSPDGRPHAVSVAVRWDGASLVCGCGRSSGRNIEANPHVSLLWPPDELDGYSLIADVVGRIEGDGDDRRAVLIPEKAVLHRSAPSPDPDSECAHDCIPLTDG